MKWILILALLASVSCTKNSDQPNENKITDQPKAVTNQLPNMGLFKKDNFNWSMNKEQLIKEFSLEKGKPEKETISYSKSIGNSPEDNPLIFRAKKLTFIFNKTDEQFYIGIDGTENSHEDLIKILSPTDIRRTCTRDKQIASVDIWISSKKESVIVYSFLGENLYTLINILPPKKTGQWTGEALIAFLLELEQGWKCE